MKTCKKCTKTQKEAFLIHSVKARYTERDDRLAMFGSAGKYYMILPNNCAAWLLLLTTKNELCYVRQVAELLVVHTLYKRERVVLEIAKVLIMQMNPLF